MQCKNIFGRAYNEIIWSGIQHTMHELWNSCHLLTRRIFNKQFCDSQLTLFNRVYMWNVYVGVLIQEYSYLYCTQKLSIFNWFGLFVYWSRFKHCAQHINYMCIWHWTPFEERYRKSPIFVITSALFILFGKQWNEVHVFCSWLMMMMIYLFAYQIIKLSKSILTRIENVTNVVLKWKMVNTK